MATTGVLTWSDDFDGPAGHPPDPDVWRHDLGGGGLGVRPAAALHQLDRERPAAGGGHLAITARREADGRISSARLTTQGRVTARHGRAEARIQVSAQVTSSGSTDA